MTHETPKATSFHARPTDVAECDAGMISESMLPSDKRAFEGDAVVLVASMVIDSERD